MSLTQSILRELAVQADDASTSQQLTIKHVMLFTFLVVLFVSVLEFVLHHVEHQLKHHHKYYEMLCKMYRGKLFCNDIHQMG